jgi:hypothetical protein
VRRRLPIILLIHQVNLRDPSTPFLLRSSRCATRTLNACSVEAEKLMNQLRLVNSTIPTKMGLRFMSVKYRLTVQASVACL